MTWTIEIEYVAGIRSGAGTIEPGLNAVQATNWQGKSSFVAAVETALGVATPLTEGRDHGVVTLETPDGTVTVELTRENGTVRRAGDPLLAEEYDVVRAELYACLDEDNPVREAVRNGENLEELLTRPLDFQNIDARIADLQAERGRVESELDGATEAANQLPKVERRITRLTEEIEELGERLQSVEGPVEEGNGKREELSRAQAERDRVRSRVGRLERSVERTEEALEEKREELDSLASPPAAEPDRELAAASEELEERRRDVEVLQSLHSANRLVLEADRLELVADVERSIAGETVACWVCGADADRETIEDRIEALGDEVGRLRAEQERLRDRIEELEAHREERRQAIRRRDDIEAEIAELESTLEERRESLADARDRLADLEDRVDALSDAVEETVETVTDIESEIKYREAELQAARDELETLEARADGKDALERRRDELTDEIEALRNRKNEVRRRAREAFDDAIGDVLDRFDTGFETARLTPGFDLVVARDGREASLDALSQGELELLGVVAALAGHESFDVGDSVPILLVDDLANLADENLTALVEYLDGRAEYVAFTAHPEDSSFDGHRIDPSDWAVVSDDAEATPDE